MPEAELKNQAKPAEAPKEGQPAPTPEQPAAEAAPKTKKTPVEEGFVAPVEFAKHLTKQTGTEVPPQMVYGYLKNMKGFPQRDRGEGATPRIVIPLQEGLDFMKAKAKEKADKAAAAVQAEEATPAAAPTS